jgi:hypothetical protein
MSQQTTRRRHTNNKGERQIRRGKTALSLDRICRSLGLPRPKHDRRWLDKEADDGKR